MFSIISSHLLHLSLPQHFANRIVSCLLAALRLLLLWIWIWILLLLLVLVDFLLLCSQLLLLLHVRVGVLRLLMGLYAATCVAPVLQELMFFQDLWFRGSFNAIGFLVSWFLGFFSDIGLFVSSVNLVSWLLSFFNVLGFLVSSKSLVSWFLISSMSLVS